MKVLLAFDASTGSQHVVNGAAALPWPTGTTFCILSIVDTARWEGLPTLIVDAKHAAQALVEKAVQRLDHPGSKVFSEIQLGFPKNAIPEFARQWKADLVMVGSRGQSALSRFFLGSVALVVLRSAPCSVEIVRPGRSGRHASPNGMKILLGTDGSERSTKAIRSLADRPWPRGSQFRVISVRDILTLENQTTVSSPCPVYPAGLLNEILEDARKRAEDAVAQAHRVLSSAGLKVSKGPETPVGDPRIVLLDEAAAWGADLVVLGSYGKHGLDRVLLGSVSESVALHAHCSVEVVRQAAHRNA
jgi:nucleotide-binding universal stress UspA family protein